MRRLKSLLMRRHRVAKSASPSGKRQMQCRCSGKTTHAITSNGRRVRSSAMQSRRQSMFAVSKSLPRRCSRFTVKNHVPPSVRSRRQFGMREACPRHSSHPISRHPAPSSENLDNRKCMRNDATHISPSALCRLRNAAASATRVPPYDCTLRTLHSHLTRLYAQPNLMSRVFEPKNSSLQLTS